MFAMIREHVGNPLGVEPRSPHECNPSVQERLLEPWIWRNRDVRVDEHATRRKRREDVVDKALLILNVMDGEERYDQVEWSLWQ